ncbi:pectinesterase family protein [Reichenbachiella carrageenanivorans]|uniref:Pectinesterase n=1 Tax=Reichenbachiella carrageenanivorans TaxID=2979869 RepID=A0ABY6D8B8_9BACT|nr:pectinesterase family protein [Reichenbachiella carrageenanivorans]UXX81328.1 pectinesterase family protein [Reichenbachiella carrageenanivorans]
MKYLLTLWCSVIYVASMALPQEGSYDLIVGQDQSSDYQSIQAAIDAIPDFRKAVTTVFIKSGTYKEKLVLPASKVNVTFIGEDAETTIITFDNYADKLNCFGEKMGTSGSASFYVFADGFNAENLTFENTAGPVGQAVAIRVDGDRVFFKNCRFLGYQDTLYTYGKKSRQYYLNCYIEGTTDFIFGASQAVFDRCTIYSKSGGHYITAANTTIEVAYGYVFLQCKLVGDAPKHDVYLGRPWRDDARTVFISCEMAEHIKPEGWHNWGKRYAEKRSYYAEYQSTGAGANAAQRVSWSHQLTDSQKNRYTLGSVFGDWNPIDTEIVKP